MTPGAPSPTPTPWQGADVYSYAADENDEVLNPNLAAHLAHWGIDIMKMEKSEKNMAELQAPAPCAAKFEFQRFVVLVGNARPGTNTWRGCDVSALGFSGVPCRRYSFFEFVCQLGC